MILTLLVPICCFAQQTSGPIHDLNQLPSLQRTQDDLHGYITKENEKRRRLPFSLVISAYPSGLVSVHLNITKTNEFNDLSGVYTYSDPDSVQQRLWVPLQPLSASSTNSLYFLNLPYEIARQSFFGLACGKAEEAAFPARDPNLRLKDLYRKVYEVRLGSYLTMIAPAPIGNDCEGSTNDADITVEIK